MKKITLLCTFIIFVNAGFSQQEKNRSLFFHSVNTVGLIQGQAGSAFSFLTINGIQYKTLFTGLGTGFDLYKLRTIPLFVSLRNEFGKKSNKLFVFADAGTNFYWKKDGDAKLYYQNDKFKNGFYGGGGFGYKVNLGRGSSFLLSAEYNRKELTESGSNDDGSYPQRINYNFNRVIIKTGFEF
ncbi:MAG: hypothetical protein QM764_11265 [Chitinophagaceae bacterium]